MGKRLSQPLVRKAWRDIGVTSIAGCLLAIVLDKGHIAFSLAGIVAGYALLLWGCYIEDDEGGSE